MRASFNWLGALLPGLSVTPKELAERFTRAGLEVEAMHEFGAGTEALVVAEVRAIAPHPTRPKLRLVTVNRGDGHEQRIVCGAPNVPDPGGLVAFAPLGTHLPAVNMTLTPRDIGGVTSEGMLCSERELGLVLPRGGEDPGILILPNGVAAPGTPLRKAIPAVHDHIFEIGVTPNRPDALGHVGLAREAAALFEMPFHFPRPEAPLRLKADTAIEKWIAVQVQDTERCPMYGAAIVFDVNVAASPLWLRYRLESLGIRSISNVVDLTNLVLLEFGHPIHAFDFDLVRDREIVVRRAIEGEILRTLDSVDRTLSPDDLVIADGVGPVALAGVMGGEGSEIRQSTKAILIECAYFQPRGVRRTARRHGLSTESSYRFERGVDPSALPDVLAHAASLVTHLAGGAAVPGSILAGPGVPARKPIHLRSRRLSALLGADVPFGEATGILKRLGCEVAALVNEEAEVTPPHHRPDLNLEADLIEEVLRVRGLDVLASTLPPIRAGVPRDVERTPSRVRAAAVGVGLSEAITYSFVSERELEAVGAPPPVVRLANPLTEDRSVMRTSLLPGLLATVGRARRHGVEDVRVFAVGARFLAPGSEPASPPAEADRDLPHEAPSFCAVIAGYRRPPLEKPIALDVLDAKGVAVEIVERVTHRKATVEHQEKEHRQAHLHPRAAANLFVEAVRVGSFGPVHPDVIDALDVGGPCFAIELDLAALERVSLRTPAFRPIPVLPAISRDFSLVVHEDVTAGQVIDAAAALVGELCEEIEVFDVYRGPTIPADHRALAFRIRYRDPKAKTDPENARTLTDDEVDKKNQAMLSELNRRFGAVLRT